MISVEAQASSLTKLNHHTCFHLCDQSLNFLIYKMSEQQYEIPEVWKWIALKVKKAKLFWMSKTVNHLNTCVLI